MWTYVVAFTSDLKRFMMVRSKKRGGWEMPGGGSEEDETPLVSSIREFIEETGHQLISREEWVTELEDGFVHFGFIGDGDPENRKVNEILEIGLFSRLPEDLAYPSVEYEPLLELGKLVLSQKN